MGQELLRNLSVSSTAASLGFAVAPGILYLASILIRNSIWFVRDSQDLLALKYGQQDILAEPRQLPTLLWGVLTCWARCLPDVYLLGAAKSGTTTLYELLALHPGICIPSAAKETQYHCGRSILRCSTAKLHLDRLFYRSFFPTIFYKHFWLKIVRGVKPLAMEGTPVLRFPWLASRMSRVNPKAKAIVVLREPKSRALSHYRMVRWHLPDKEPLDFAQAVRSEEKRTKFARLDALCTDAGGSMAPILEQENAFDVFDRAYNSAGLYHSNLKRWEAQFGNDRLMILSFEEFIAETQKVLDRICKFLEIPRIEVPEDLKPKNALNKLKLGIDDETDKFLDSVFAESNRALVKDYGIGANW